MFGAQAHLSRPLIMIRLTITTPYNTRHSPIARSNSNPTPVSSRKYVTLTFVLNGTLPYLQAPMNTARGASSLGAAHSPMQLHALSMQGVANAFQREAKRDSLERSGFDRFMRTVLLVPDGEEGMFLLTCVSL